MRRSWVVAAWVLCGGCSWLYDSDDLRGRDGGAIADARADGNAIDAPIDAPPDAPPDGPPPDVDPADLTVDALDPPALIEGVGSGGSRPMVVVLEGHNMIEGATIDAAIIGGGPDGADLPLEIGEVAISPAGYNAACTVVVPVRPLLDDSAEEMVRFTVTQGETSRTLDVPLLGLDELAPPAGSFDTANLRPRYSQARFTAAVHFEGSAPALIRVTGDITLSARLDVDASDETPGAHGCGGGEEAVQGGCGDGGGGGGASMSGGAGGGGFGSAGSAGSGGAGQPTGEEMLLDLVFDPNEPGNRGNGGGGGGTAALGAGGPGGGGGGVLELTAGGTITVTGAGALRARGGNGTAGQLGGGGGGGGGSGGALLVRSGVGVSAPGLWLSAPRGNGADNGGNGGNGRIRIDTPSAGVAAMATEPSARRGAAFATDTPRVVRSASVEVTLVGDVARVYGVRGNGPEQEATADDAGLATVSLVDLDVGRNVICAEASPAATAAHPEGANCIEIAYIP